MLPNLKNILLALFMGLLLGIVGGFYTKDKFFKAEQVERVVEVRKTDAENVKQVAQADAELGQRQEKKDEAVTQAKTQVARIEARAKHLSSTAPAKRPDETAVCRADPQVPEQAESQDSPDSGLSVAHVRMLNAARAGALDPGLEPSDGEIATSAAIARAEFLENDLEVVRRYHRLAEAHDELVSEVEKLQAEQRKRLGLSD